MADAIVEENADARLAGLRSALSFLDRRADRTLPHTKEHERSRLNKRQPSQPPTSEDAQDVLVAVSPIVGTTRVVSATGNIAKALDFAIGAIAELEADDD